MIIIIFTPNAIPSAKKNEYSNKPTISAFPCEIGSVTIN